MRETPEQITARLAADAARRAALRSELERILRESGAGDLAERLRKCAEPLHLTCTCCGEARTVETGCRKRWCPVCARKLAAQKCDRYALALQRLEWPLFVTLTVRSSGYAAQSVREVITAFKAFRRRAWWRKCNIRGGIYGVEITHGAHGWHPHLHLLLDCEWMAIDTAKIKRGMTPEEKRRLCQSAQRELAREWAEHVGQETAIIWVKRAKKGTEREVVKYTVNPEDLIEMGDKAAEAIRCMGGVRATQCWGTLYGLVAESKRLENEAHKPAKCATCNKSSWMPSAVVSHLMGAASKRHEREKRQAARDLPKVNRAITRKVADVAAWRPVAETLRKYDLAMKNKRTCKVQRSQTPSVIRI